LDDLRRLLLLQLPVRCRSCKLRSFVFLPSIFRIRQESRLRRHKQRPARSASAPEVRE
jgi:hypothetical protein